MLPFVRFFREFAVRRPEPKDTLGIPRSSMPQIETEDYDELYKYLKNHGLSPKAMKVNPAELKALQRDFKTAGVVKALQKEKVKKPVIISNDNYVIDGNHRWLAALNTRLDKIDAIMFPANGVKLLALVKKFHKVGFKGLYD